ncbi:hypothetical protein ACQEU3_47125 [Spirillospora sp. CA-253888]
MNALTWYLAGFFTLPALTAAVLAVAAWRAPLYDDRGDADQRSYGAHPRRPQ